MFLCLTLNLFGTVTTLIEVYIPVLGPQRETDIKKVLFVTYYSLPESEINFTCQPYFVNKVPERIEEFKEENINLASLAGIKIADCTIYGPEGPKITIDVKNLKSVNGIPKEKILKLTIKALILNLKKKGINHCIISILGKQQHPELKWAEYEITDLTETLPVFYDLQKFSHPQTKYFFVKNIEYEEIKKDTYRPKETKITFEEDIDGDEKKEKVLICIGNDAEKDYTFTIYINNKKMLSDYIERVDRIGVVDIDSKDEFKEIEIYSVGPSDDFISRFYRFEKNKVKFMGELSRLAWIEDGLLYVHDWTGHWSISRKYYIDRDGKFQEVNQPFYWVGLKLKIEKEIPVYFSPEKKSIVDVAKKGEEISIIFEKEGNLLVKTQKDLVGWVKLSDIAIACESTLPTAD